MIPNISIRLILVLFIMIYRGCSFEEYLVSFYGRLWFFLNANKSCNFKSSKSEKNREICLYKTNIQVNILSFLISGVHPFPVRRSYICDCSQGGEGRRRWRRRERERRRRGGEGRSSYTLYWLLPLSQPIKEETQFQYLIADHCVTQIDLEETTDIWSKIGFYLSFADKTFSKRWNTEK